MATDDEKNQAKADAALAEYHQHRDKGFDDGGAAYPWRQPQEQDGKWQQEGWGDGMTLLDHFAGIAMQMDAPPGITAYPHALAKASYLVAAAMIEEKRRLEKEATS